LGDKGDEGMPALADLALGMAPIAGGIALGAAVGYLKGPDIRKGVWRPVPGAPGFEASNRGAVRNARIKHRLKIDRSHRYPRITIRAERRYLHAVVAEAWRGPRPAGLLVLHGDDDAPNCQVSNLLPCL
jgi:HNH endonuclease